MRKPTMLNQLEKEKKTEAKNGVLPTQVARFHLEKGKLPESMKPQMRDYLFDLNQVLRQAVPQTISTIIAYVPQHWENAHEEIELYAFGRFRSHYRVINKLADIFATPYVKSAILPRVNPVSSVEWAQAAKHNGTVKRNIEKNGLVIYER